MPGHGMSYRSLGGEAESVSAPLVVLQYTLSIAVKAYGISVPEHLLYSDML